MALISVTCVHLEGSAKKRFGIDGDREAVPLTLEVLYNKVRRPLVYRCLRSKVIKEGALEQSAFALCSRAKARVLNSAVSHACAFFCVDEKLQ